MASAGTWRVSSPPTSDARSATCRRTRPRTRANIGRAITTRKARGIVDEFFHLLASHPFMTIFFVLGLGYLVGRISLGFFSPGSTAGSLLVALVVGGLAFKLAGVRFQISDLVGTIFLALFTYA